MPDTLPTTEPLVVAASEELRRGPRGRGAK